MVRALAYVQQFTACEESAFFSVVVAAEEESLLELGINIEIESVPYESIPTPI